MPAEVNLTWLMQPCIWPNISPRWSLLLWETSALVMTWKVSHKMPLKASRQNHWTTVTTIGKPQSLALWAVPMREGCSISTSKFQCSIHSDLLRWGSSPRSSIPMSTGTGTLASTQSSKATGSPASLWPRCSSPSSPCWPTPTATSAWSPRLASCAGRTGTLSMPWLASGLGALLCTMPYFAVMLVLEDKLSHFLGSYTALSETQKEEETEYMYTHLH